MATNLFDKQNTKPSNNVQPIFSQTDPYRKAPQTDDTYQFATAGQLDSGSLFKDPQTGTIGADPRLLQGSGIAPPISPGAYVSDAARLFGGAVSNNPFISQAARTGFGEGQIPGMNQISPAFFRYTTPSIAQSLLGLFESIGRPRADTLFTIDRFRPPGIR